MPQMQEVTLATIERGAAVELFARELEKVTDNITDLMTGEGKRKIVLTFTFEPSMDRTSAQVEIKAESKLAPVAPHPAMVYIGKKNGKLGAFEADANQLDMFDGDTGEVISAPNVTTFNQKEAL